MYSRCLLLQERIRQDLTEWMKYMRNSIGYDGWRFDFVRGYKGEYAKIYIDATVPEMAFGEYWDSCDYTDGVLNYNQVRAGGRLRCTCFMGRCLE